MAKQIKKKTKAIEVNEPKIVKNRPRKGEKKYTVLLPYSTGTGESAKDYKPNDIVYYLPKVAQQFINAHKIK